MHMRLLIRWAVFALLIVILVVPQFLLAAQDMPVIPYDELFKSQITVQEGSSYQFEVHANYDLIISMFSNVSSLTVSIKSPSGLTTDTDTSDATFATINYQAPEDGLYTITVTPFYQITEPVPLLIKIGLNSLMKDVAPPIQAVPDTLTPITADNAAQLVQVAQLGWGHYSYSNPSFMWSPDGQIFTVVSPYEIALYPGDFTSPAKFLYPSGNTAFLGASFKPDGKQLAAAQNDGTVYVWDVASGTIQKTLSDAVTSPTNPIYNLFVDFGSHTLAVGRSFDDSYTPDKPNLERVFVWNTDSWQKTTELKVKSEDGIGRLIKGVKISRDDSLIGAFFQDNYGPQPASVAIWDVKSGEQHTLLNLEADVSNILFVGQANDLFIRLSAGVAWMPGDGSAAPVTISPDNYRLGNRDQLVTNADQSLVMAAGDDGVMLLDAPTHSFVSYIETNYHVRALEPNTMKAVTTEDYSYPIQALTDVMLNTPLINLNINSYVDFTYVAISPDGNWFATRDPSEQSSIALLNLHTGQLMTIAGPGGNFAVHGIIFSPDSKTLAGLIYDGIASGTIAEWDIGSPDRRVQINFESGYDGSPRFIYTPDGSKIKLDQVTDRSSNAPLVLWYDAASGNPTTPFTIDVPISDKQGLTNLNGLSLKVDNSYYISLVAGSGNPIFQFPGKGIGFFSPDGKLIYTFDQDIMRVWAVGAAKAAEAASNIPIVSFYGFNGNLIVNSNPDGTGQKTLLHSSQGAIDTSVIWSPDGKTYTQIPDASWSPDGKKVVYVGTFGSEAHHIFIANPDGSDATQLTELGYVSSSKTLSPSIVSWSPDGQKLLFNRDKDNYTDTGDLYTASPQGANIQQLTRTKDVWEEQGKWSPDGKMIAFISVKRLSYDSALEVMNANGSNRRVLYQMTNDNGNSGSFINNFIWSPDGQTLLFTVGSLHSDLYLAPINGGKAQKFISNAQHPAWSSDGRYIAYESVDDTQYISSNIVVANADGSNPVQLTTDGGMYPNWQPIPGATPVASIVEATAVPTVEPTLQPAATRTTQSSSGGIGAPAATSVPTEASSGGIGAPAATSVPTEASSGGIGAPAATSVPTEASSGSIGTAPIVQTLRYGEGLLDTLGPNASVKWQFEGQKGDFVRVEIEFPNGDFEVQAPDNYQMQADSDGDFINGAILPLDGIYTITITERKGIGGDYTIEIVEEAVGGEGPTSPVQPTEAPTSAQSSVPAATPVSCPGVLPSKLVAGQEGEVVYDGTNRATRIRSGGGLSFAKVGEISAGSQFTVLEGPQCSDGYAWYKINYNGLIGWSAESGDGAYWLSPLDDTSSATASDAAPTDACTATADGLINLRRGPGTNYAKAGQSPDGSTFLVKRQYTSSSGFVWYKLDNGFWAREDAVFLMGDCTAVAIGQ